MKLEVGKKYRTRDGEAIFKILEINSPNENYPVIAMDTEDGAVEIFTKEGFASSVTIISKEDLVEEVVEPRKVVIEGWYCFGEMPSEDSIERLSSEPWLKHDVKVKVTIEEIVNND